MKKIQQLLTLAAVALGMASCSGYLDDIEPRHAIAQSSLSENDMSKVLNGVYAKMESYTYTLWWYDDIQGENFATSIGQTPMPDPCNMNPSSVGTNTNVLSYWRNSFSALNQVNFLVESFEASDNKETTAMKKIGAAVYYFRAFIYYRLASHFGNVPILRERTDAIVPISPEADVWAFVEENLENARVLATNSDGKWYVTLDAVNALAARVALFQGKKTDAAAWADEVLKNTKYSLSNTDMKFSSIFVFNTSSTEIIFGYVNNSRTSGYLNFTGTVNDTDSSWDYSPDPDLQQTLFADHALSKRTGDIRHRATFYNSTEANASARIIKFSNGTQELAPNSDYVHTPILVSRIAEIYLIKAEALGKEGGAATLHEFLKNRYEGDVLTEAEIKSMSDADYQDLILDERRREFYAEGMRWQDVKRTQRYDLLKTLNGRTYLMYYPIPQEEIDIAGKEAYPQNAGY
ncbi:MAG: RagB/SusD family nutrient uptake outer membrane protein [Bacteroides sp.]|nr:RagB/SusD family nutrient uptake outer membrane protein [Bacteroides sp.]